MSSPGSRPAARDTRRESTKRSASTFSPSYPKRKGWMRSHDRRPTRGAPFHPQKAPFGLRALWKSFPKYGLGARLQLWLSLVRKARGQSSVRLGSLPQPPVTAIRPPDVRASGMPGVRGGGRGIRLRGALSAHRRRTARGVRATDQPPNLPVPHQGTAFQVRRSMGLRGPRLSLLPPEFQGVLVAGADKSDR